MISDLSLICISPDRTLREAIALIDKNRKGIVLITDKEGALLNTITDGDVRRAMLAGVGLEIPVSDLLASRLSKSLPVTAPVETDDQKLLQLMQNHQIRQIPLIDAKGRVRGLVALDELLPNEVLPVQAVIMAGGSGVRLRPLTDELPKPMLPVGGRPVLELLVEQLRQSGIRRLLVPGRSVPSLSRSHRSRKLRSLGVACRPRRRRTAFIGHDSLSGD